jgi:hypothetical protein
VFQHRLNERRQWQWWCLGIGGTCRRPKLHFVHPIWSVQRKGVGVTFLVVLARLFLLLLLLLRLMLCGGWNLSKYNAWLIDPSKWRQNAWQHW